MADDTLQGGSADVIATDHVTTLNGAAVTQTASSPKVQRMKVAYGDDGTSRDVSPSFPLPMFTPDGAASGTITATDTVVGTHAGAGAPLTGTPTASSYVLYRLSGGESGLTFRLSGTFGGGTVWVEVSPDSTNGLDGGWTTLLSRQSGIGNTFLDADITAPGIFRSVVAGYSYLRFRITGATTPSVTVAARASGSPSVTALVASLPPGGNTIGAVNLAGTLSATTPVTQALTAAGASTLAGATSTAGSAVIDVNAAGNVSFHLLATAFVGTVVFEQSFDPAGANGTWAAVPVLPEDGLSAPLSTLSINTAVAYVRQFTQGMFGPSLFRVRVTAFTSGSLTAYLKAGPGWVEPQPALAPSASTIGQVQQTPQYTIGTGTGTAPATTGQVGRPVRATGTAAVTAATALIAAPAAGTRIYVTNISCTNEGAAATALRLYAAGTVPVAAAATLTVLNDVFDFFMAANGGGASMNLALTPWALPAATALNLFVSVATTWSVTVTYYVAP